MEAYCFCYHCQLIILAIVIKVVVYYTWCKDSLILSSFFLLSAWISAEKKLEKELVKKTAG